MRVSGCPMAVAARVEPFGREPATTRTTPHMYGKGRQHGLLLFESEPSLGDGRAKEGYVKPNEGSKLEKKGHRTAINEAGTGGETVFDHGVKSGASLVGKSNGIGRSNASQSRTAKRRNRATSAGEQIGQSVGHPRNKRQGAYDRTR